MMNFKVFFSTIRDGLDGIKSVFFSGRSDRYGYIHPTSSVKSPAMGIKKNIYIYEHCGINGGMHVLGTEGRFTLKRNCSVSVDLMVITSNHQYDKVGQFPESENWSKQYPAEVVVNEDVWIGAKVILCPGANIGRGSIVAAGSVCTKSGQYPPYSIIGGNPAKFIKFRLSLEDQIEQEKLRYQPNERIPYSELEANWSKFINK